MTKTMTATQTMNSHSHIGQVDDVILQVFEDSEDDGAFYFPLTTQKQARAFVKALHTKGISYSTICNEIVELEQNFNSWRTGIGRPGIGNRVIERINRPIQELLLSDLTDDSSELQDLSDSELTSDASPCHQAATCESASLTGSCGDEQSAAGETSEISSQSTTSPTEERFSKTECAIVSDQVEQQAASLTGSCGDEQSAAGETSEISSQSTTSPTEERFSKTECDIVSDQVELVEKLVQNTIPTADTNDICAAAEDSNLLCDDRPGFSGDMAVNDCKPADVEVVIIDSSTTVCLAMSTPDGSHIDSSKMNLCDKVTHKDDAHQTVDENVVVENAICDRDNQKKPAAESELLIESQLCDQVLGTCNEPSEIEPKSSNDNQVIEKTINEQQQEQQQQQSLSADSTSRNSSAAEVQHGNDISKTTAPNGVVSAAGCHDNSVEQETGEFQLNDRIVSNGTVTNGIVLCSAEVNNVDFNQSKLTAVVDENYNSDDDTGGSRLLKTAVQRTNEVDGPGYVYAFTDTNVTAPSIGGNYRIKIGASRQPYSRLRQAALFNIEIRLVSAVNVSARLAATRAVKDQLSSMAIPDTVGWYVGPLDAVLDALMTVSRQFPIISDSDC